MHDFTFLSDDEVLYKNKLSIFDKISCQGINTDFARFLGGYDIYGYGRWLTKSFGQNGTIKTITPGGSNSFQLLSHRTASARPAITYSHIKHKATNERVNCGVKEVEYGEYPQSVVDESIAKKLESAYLNKSIKTTGKRYTTDKRKIYNFNNKFTERIHIEYEYEGKKYIRVEGDENSVNVQLSDGRIIEEKKPYWLEVEPIVWLVDEESNIALSKRLLFAGIQFNRVNNFHRTLLPLI